MWIVAVKATCEKPYDGAGVYAFKTFQVELSLLRNPEIAMIYS